jgi:hypothetical protein
MTDEQPKFIDGAMTEEEGEKAHDAYMELSAAITELVDRKTAGLTPDADQYVRTLLLETQRYWRD